MTARDEILAKIKRALDKAAVAPLLPHASLSAQQVLRECEAQRDELIARFGAMLALAGGYFSVARNPQALAAGIESCAVGAQTQKVVAWHSPLLEQLGLTSLLAEDDIELITDADCADKAAFIREAAEAGLGITTVDYALADSGTLCVLAGKNQPRTASLLPPIHIAILRPEQILRGLDDLFALLPTGDDLSSAVTLITGPSRTADIELTLVVGVHGPQRLHVILANY